MLPLFKTLINKQSCPPKVSLPAHFRLTVSLFFLIFTPLVTFAQTTIKYCIDPSWAPYESIEDGRHLGISKHYVDLVSQKSGIEFQFHPTKTWQASLNSVKNGDCQLIPFLNHSDLRAKYMSFSQVYFRSPNVIYAHLDHSVIGGLSAITTQTVGTVKGYRVIEYLRKHFPKMNIREVATEQQGLELVSTGSLDFFIGSAFSSNYIVQQSGLHKVRIVGIASIDDQLRFGVAKNRTELIIPINNALSQISPAEHKKIFSKIKHIQMDKPHDYKLAGQIAIFALIILLLGAIRHFESLRQRRILTKKNSALEQLHQALEKKNQELERLATHDTLTGLFNRGYLTEQIEKIINKKRRYQSPCTMLLLDIDNFKNYNDTYGHNVGDQMLKHTADAIRTCVRETDIFARWGGEEFIILCPESELKEALKLAKRLQQHLVDNPPENFKNITCSIGLAELNIDDTMMQWVNNADQAMYQAKANGKNTYAIS